VPRASIGEASAAGWRVVNNHPRRGNWQPSISPAAGYRFTRNRIGSRRTGRCWCARWSRGQVGSSSGYWKTSSNGTSKTQEILKATSREGRVRLAFDGVDGLPRDADAVGQLGLAHLAGGSPQGRDPVGYRAR
jgi:hypothetical protein